ncbi:ABC transporter substrate-binding protein [Marinobacter algicola]|uniref:ABC transporter substrate-binding protein n=1 Tax=Marinobacter algicola TaxID=236100 RepID=UPI003BA96456
MLNINKKCSALRKAGLTAGAVMALAFGTQTMAADKPVKLGIFLPYSGTYGHIGGGVDMGIRLAIEQNGGKLGGRDVEFVVVDSEADPSKAVANMQQLISGEQVDFVLGPVHSGVAMGALRVARQGNTILVIPNAGLNVATRQLCAPNIFRTSFSNWQTDHGMAQPAWDRGMRNVVTISWRYSAGEEHLSGFEEEFKRLGGTIEKRILVPFPDVDFQAQLTQIASMNPDGVYAFFAGGGAVRFLQDYAAAGLNNKIQLMGAGFLTDSLSGLDGIADGTLTTIHYADALDNEYNKAFRKAYLERFDKEALIYSVQGYDTGKLLVKAMDTVKGNTDDRDALLKAMREVRFDDSPRGPWHFSKAQNPIQDMYLLEVQNNKNVVLGVAVKGLEDPGTGCSMMQ